MKVVNRKYNREYQKIESYEVGIVLSGAEVKSVKRGSIHLEDAFVRFLADGPYLINADIPIYKFARPAGYDSRRSRKLLLHKGEIIRLQTKLKSAKGLTMAPLACYNKGSLVKLEIALSKGRREIEMRKLEKRRDIEREEKKEIKEYMK